MTRGRVATGMGGPLGESNSLLCHSKGKLCKQLINWISGLMTADWVARLPLPEGESNKVLSFHW